MAHKDRKGVDTYREKEPCESEKLLKTSVQAEKNYKRVKWKWSRYLRSEQLREKGYKIEETVSLFYCSSRKFRIEMIFTWWWQANMNIF